MKSAELAHLTINTADLRMSPRSEVSTEALAVCRPLTLPGRHRIPGMPPELWVECRRKNAGRATMIIGDEAGTYIVAQLAWTEDAADAAWPSVIALARDSGVIAPALHLPPLPWLAVMLAPVCATLPPQTLMFLADFERCWAWAVLEKP